MKPRSMRSNLCLFIYEQPPWVALLSHQKPSLLCLFNPDWTPSTSFCVEALCNTDTHTHWGSEGCAAGSVATDLQSDSRGSMYHLKRISLHLSNITWDFIDSLKSSLLRSRLICSPLLSKTPNKHQSFFSSVEAPQAVGLDFRHKRALVDLQNTQWKSQVNHAALPPGVSSLFSGACSYINSLPRWISYKLPVRELKGSQLGLSLRPETDWGLMSVRMLCIQRMTPYLCATAHLFPLFASFTQQLRRGHINSITHSWPLLLPVALYHSQTWLY